MAINTRADQSKKRRQARATRARGTLARNLPSLPRSSFLVNSFFHSDTMSAARKSDPPLGDDTQRLLQARIAELEANTKRTTPKGAPARRGEKKRRKRESLVCVCCVYVCAW